jgi:predicted MFS family arabinose efflux permease
MEILYTAIFAKLFLTAAPKDVCGTFWHVLVIAFMVVVAGNSLWLNRYIVDSVINSGDAVSAINSMVVLGSILGSIIGAVIYKFRQE